jgi:hypothetical protein
MRRQASFAIAMLLAAGHAHAEAIAWHGYLDVRLVDTGGEPNWMDGGFGKLRWGGADAPLQPAAALVVEAPFAPAWLARAGIQAQPDDGDGIELLEAWVRWRPVSTGRWRHALKAGLMFPPVSLENDAVAWTSPYTLTPSAINTWVGEELRSTALEWRAERRGDTGSAELALTLFGGNDTTGELLATRGWALSDRVYGVWGSIRTPDPTAREAPPPRRFYPFVEIDDRVGVSGEITLRRPGMDRVSLLRYDNRADPTVATHFGAHAVYAWRTRFTALAWERRGARSVWLAQAMEGDTEIRPSPFFRTRTDFWALAALWARTDGAWRPAARAEWFGARQWPDGMSGNEHGRALTLALAWHPDAHQRISGEVIALRSVRGDRVELGLDQARSEVQAQVSWRWVF